MGNNLKEHFEECMKNPEFKNESEKLERKYSHDTGRGIVKVLKGYTAADFHRHYYPEHEEWQLVEATETDIKFEMTGQAEVLLSRDEAEDLSRLLRHFADHGTLPVPYKQQPSTTCS